MRQGRLRFWGWFVGTCVLLMLLTVEGLVLFGSRQGYLEAVAVAVGAFAVIPVMAFALWIIWIVYPLAFWLFWRYLLLIDWVTGIGIGRWFTGVLTRDTFLMQSREGTTSNWLFQRVEAYRHKVGKAEAGHPTDA